MARPNSETVTTFGEVLHSANNAHYRGSRAANIDNRLMIYFQGMKVYVPDGFQADTLLKLLQTLKKLSWPQWGQAPLNFYKLLLEATKQYFYFSSARVYANSDVLTEDSQRLLDSNIDLQYVQSDEYAIAKAKQEDILRNSDFRIGQL